MIKWTDELMCVYIQIIEGLEMFLFDDSASTTTPWLEVFSIIISSIFPTTGVGRFWITLLWIICAFNSAHFGQFGPIVSQQLTTGSLYWILHEYTTRCSAWMIRAKGYNHSISNRIGKAELHLKFACSLVWEKSHEIESIK